MRGQEFGGEFLSASYDFESAIPMRGQESFSMFVFLSGETGQPSP